MAKKRCEALFEGWFGSGGYLIIELCFLGLMSIAPLGMLVADENFTVHWGFWKVDGVVACISFLVR